MSQNNFQTIYSHSVKRIKMASRAAATILGVRRRQRKRSRANYPIHMDEQPDVHVPLGFEQSLTPWYVVFIFVVSLQVGLLQLHFHDSTPFKTHPVNMWAFVFAVFIYCIALAYYVKNWLIGSTCYNNICDKVGYIFGLLSSAAFISMLVPPSLEPLIFTIWIVISAMFIDFAYNWILKMALKLYELSKDAISYAQDILKPIIGTNNEEATTMHV